MIRSVLALAVRSLREDSRSLVPHLFRLLFAAAILIALIHAQMQSTLFGAPGLKFFSTLCWLNFTLITAGAVSIFATPITEEKEEATLGLLRMAGISPVGLLLGKSGTRLFAAVLILAIQFPFTLLSITLGGILWHQIVAANLALLAYLVLAAQLGLVCSVACARSSTAAMAAGLLLGAFLALPYPLMHFFGIARTTYGPYWLWGPLEDAAGWLVNACIWYTLNQTLATGFAGDELSTQFWSNLAAAGVLFGLSWLTFDVFTRDHLTSVPSRGALFRWRAGKSNAARRWFSPGRAWDLPLAWKEFHYTAGGFSLVLGKLLGYLLIIVTISMFFILSGVNVTSIWEVFGKCAWAIMLIVAPIELAIHASRVFREELKWQTYSVLMTLPTTIGPIAWSKVLGCLLSVFPGVFWLGVGVAVDAHDVGWFFREAFDDVPMLMIFFLMHYLVFLFLTVWLSLLLKWGGLPLAFVISYPLFWTMLFGCMNVMLRGAGGGDETVNVIFGMLDFACLLLIGMLTTGIWYQLHVQAERG